MRKWVLVALATGAMVMLQRRAARMGSACFAIYGGC